MRIKDETKVDRIYKSAIKVVNNEGFQGTSMKKIGREANVSAATIYLYFDNKDDMIKKLFSHLKKIQLSSLFLDNTELTPSKGTFRTIWLNHYQYLIRNTEEFTFLENFSNCSLILQVENENNTDYCGTFEGFLEQSKKSGIIKDLNNDLIYSLLFSPINHLIKKSYTGGSTLKTNDLLEIFEASWRSIEK